MKIPISTQVVCGDCGMKEVYNIMYTAQNKVDFSANIALKTLVHITVKITVHIRNCPVTTRQFTTNIPNVRRLQRQSCSAIDDALVQVLPRHVGILTDSRLVV